MAKYGQNSTLWPFCHGVTLNYDNLNLVVCLIGGSAILGKMRSQG